MELNVLKSPPGPREREFCLGGAVGVVKGRLRGATLGDEPEVIDCEGLRKATFFGVWLPPLEAQQLSKVAGPRDSSLNHG